MNTDITDEMSGENVLNQASGDAKEWMNEKADVAKETLKEAVSNVNKHMSPARWIALGAIVGMGIVAGCLLKRH